jgi:hypothetical protein
MESSSEITQETKNRPPYDPMIPLLVIYPNERAPGYTRATCTPMFIAALFTIAKFWKQSGCHGLRKCGIYVQYSITQP